MLVFHNEKRDDSAENKNTSREKGAGWDEK